jgi:hypothetical protein
VQLGASSSLQASPRWLWGWGWYCSRWLMSAKWLKASLLHTSHQQTYTINILRKPFKTSNRALWPTDRCYFMFLSLYSWANLNSTSTFLHRLTWNTFDHGGAGASMVGPVQCMVWGTEIPTANPAADLECSDWLMTSTTSCTLGRDRLATLTVTVLVTCQHWSRC